MQDCRVAVGFWGASTEVLLPVGVRLSKNPDDGGNLPILLSPKDSLAYLSDGASVTSNEDS